MKKYLLPVMTIAILFLSPFIEITEATPQDPPPDPVLTVNQPTEFGSISPTGGSYPINTVVTMTATPDQGYYLWKWTDDLAGEGVNRNNANPDTITMDSNKTVGACYKYSHAYSPPLSIFQIRDAHVTRRAYTRHACSIPVLV